MRVMQGKQGGFTLVEIAIVLVIIGLLLGGILKGQEMITQAKIKNVVADFSGVSAAYYGYQDRYRAIPGDDPNAATRWTVAPAAVAGGGNGVIQGKYNSQTDADESRKWWDHLRRAGFVSGSGYSQPFNALAGIIGVQTGDAGTPTIGPAMGGISGLMVCSTNLTDKVAIALDTQMDDGAPEKGTVRADLQGPPNPDLDNTVPSGYQETGTNIYVVCRAM
ncbi:MAG TPA: prepilin-type N-terminal cleavage/methylation domain-containing protein [Burkholderiales bacterium]|nr:prepilin-type N-terminal cleavage/methylation domain-containing protein [Burkholderiales bacterium]